jgi:hypothetical protein
MTNSGEYIPRFKLKSDDFYKNDPAIARSGDRIAYIWEN